VKQAAPEKSMFTIAIYYQKNKCKENFNPEIYDLLVFLKAKTVIHKSNDEKLNLTIVVLFNIIIKINS
jgi:hypothetical protein